MCKQIQRCNCGHNQLVEVKCVKNSHLSQFLRASGVCRNILKDEGTRDADCDPCEFTNEINTSFREAKQHRTSANRFVSRNQEAPALGDRSSVFVRAWIEDQCWNNPPAVGSNQAPEIVSQERQDEELPVSHQPPMTPDVVDITSRRRQRSLETSYIQSPEPRSPRKPISRPSEEVPTFQNTLHAQYEDPRPAPRPPVTLSRYHIGEPGSGYAHHRRAQNKNEAGRKAGPPFPLDIDAANVWRNYEPVEPRSENASPSFFGGLFSSRSTKSKNNPRTRRPSTSSSIREGLRHLGSSIRSMSSHTKPEPAEDESFFCVTAGEQSRKGLKTTHYERSDRNGRTYQDF